MWRFMKESEIMKINFACGKQTWPGFYCIDAAAHPKASRKPDLIYVMKFHNGHLINPLNLKDECADELHSYHFIEHVYYWEAGAVLIEWRRLLIPGGKLILELPNIEAAAKNLICGMDDQMCMWPFYGDPCHKDEYMCHRWGYTPTTIVSLLKHHGFKKIQVLKPRTHGARTNRDMRVEAIK